jgi:DNA-binding transcriptional LysR family regulator
MAAVSILHAKDEVERAIAELRGGTRGRLILGAGTTGGMYVLPRIVQAYKAVWPETEVRLHTGTTDQLLEQLQQNVLDMALVGGPIEDRRFDVVAICGDQLALIAAPTHALASLGKVTLRDLVGVPFIVPESGSRTRQLVERRLREAGVPLAIAMQMAGTEGVKRAVEAGLGVGMVSRYAVEAEVTVGVLRRLPIEGFDLRRTMHLVSRTRQYFSPMGVKFREFARSYGARHLDPLPPAAGRPGGARARKGGARRSARKTAP